MNAKRHAFHETKNHNVKHWIRIVSEYFPRFKDAKLETCRDLPEKLMAKLVEDFVKERKSIYAWGAFGSGKTFACFAIIRELLYVVDKFFSPRYISAKEFDGMLLSAVKGDGDAYLISEFAKCDLLFLDDIDKVTATDRFKSQVFEIISVRYERGLQTIITSNSAPDEVGSLRDGAIISRFSDEMAWSIFRFPQRDLRPFNKLKIKGIGYDEIGDSGVENTKNILGEGTP